MAGCTSCPTGIKALLSRKLGRCPTCMRASAWGALTSWAAATALYFAWPIPALLVASLLLATAFTLLLLAHIIVFTVRTAAHWEMMRAAAPLEVKWTPLSRLSGRPNKLRVGRAQCCSRWIDQADATGGLGRSW